jgi:membrane fusion protein (multidrug efflux system)
MQNSSLSHFSFLFLVFTAIILTACGGNDNPNFHQAPEVVTQKIVPQTIPIAFENVGVIQSSHPVEIRSRITGYLQKIAYVEGQTVKEGDLLFKIDPRQFEAALESRNAELAKQEAILWEAKRSVERLEPLYNQKAASLRDLDNAKAKKLAAEADVEAAKAHVKEATLDLGYTEIRSPIAGLTSKASFYEGALISAGQPTPLATISLIDPIWVDFSVSEGRILKTQREIAQKRLIFPKDDNFEVEVILADDTIFKEKGKLNFASPTYQQNTGTLQLRGVIPNPDSILRPGQFVRAKLSGAMRPDAIIIPQKAVIQSQKGPFVFIVNQEKKAEIRYIEPGEWYGDQWIVESGLQAGEEIIVDGVNKIQPGTPVRVKAS